MKGKNLAILAAIVCAVLAYILLFERHRPTSDEASQAAEKVLRGFERDDVETLSLERGDQQPAHLAARSGDQCSRLTHRLTSLFVTRGSSG